MKPKSGKTSKTSKSVPKVQKPAVSAATIKKTLKKVIEKDLLPDPAGGVSKLKGGRRTRNVQNKPVNEEPASKRHGTKNKLQNDREAASSDQAQRNVEKRQKTSLLEFPKLSTQGGAVLVVGENDVGQLGLKNVETKKRPAELPLDVPIVEIAAGGMHSVCLSANGEVYTFGCNDEGALGRPQTDDDSEVYPAAVNLPEEMVMISAGDSHTAALSVTGKVYLWGNFRNSKGAMGLTPSGKKQTAPLRILEDVEIVKISSGAEHLVCLSSDGDVYTCGCAESGQLGRITPRSAEDGGRRGGMKSLLIPGIVKVGGKKRKFDNIWTGSYCTFMHETNSQHIYAFGLNNYHHLGYNNKEEEIARYAPKLVPSFPEGTRIISGGQHHTLALDRLGHVYSVGRNDYGRLGIGTTTGEVSELKLIPSLENENCCDIGCGNCVSFAVNTNGNVYSWGMGDSYQLGHGNEDDCLVPTVIEGNMASWHVLRVASGGQHTLILAHKKDK